MIKIIAKKHVRPGMVESFISTAGELVEKSRAEAGNVYYTLNRSLREENTLVYVECWRDREAIAAHNEYEHFKRLVPILNAMCVDAVLPELYEELDL